MSTPIKPLTARDVVLRLGGPANIGRYIGTTHQNVCYWVRTGRIPLKHAAKLESLAKQRRSTMRVEQMPFHPPIDWASLREAPVVRVGQGRAVPVTKFDAPPRPGTLIPQAMKGDKI